MVTDTEDTAGEPDKPRWTEAQQAEQYERAQKLARRLRPGWAKNHPDRCEEAASNGWERWRNESNTAKVDRYVEWATKSLAANLEKTHKREISTDAVREVHTPGTNIEARQELKALTQQTPAATAKVSIVGIGQLTEIRPEHITPDQLRVDLGMLSDKWRIAAEKDPGNERLRQVATILIALSELNYDPTKIAGMAEHWLKENNRGPRTRMQEADILANVVARGDAKEVVEWLLVLPRLAGDTTLPTYHRTWAEGEEQQATTAVQRVLDGTIGEAPRNIAKAVMRALGAPKDKVKNMYEHHRKAAKRKADS